MVLSGRHGIVVIGTRASALAMAQTGIVVARLKAAHPGLSCHVKQISTVGDRDQSRPLTGIGGQGVFVREIDKALLTGEIDLAVHSLKDVPTAQPDESTIGAVLPRGDARDALVSRLGLPLQELPEGACVGTGSTRREAQLRALRPDLEIVGLRGNVDTRLRKATTEAYDAIVLATAGLVRLGRAGEITEILPPEVMLPAVGQGAICVQVRSDDREALEAVGHLDDAGTRAAVTAERSFLRMLGGGCRVPIAAHAVTDGDELWLRGLVSDRTGVHSVKGEVRGPSALASELGRNLAHRLREAGAAGLLASEDGRD